MFFVSWIIIFFYVIQQFCSVIEAVQSSDGVWSDWTSWSECNTHDFARHTRFRKCLYDGTQLNTSQCVGLSKRTRQCDSCSYPLLNLTLPSAANLRGYNITSLGFHATNRAWCSSQLSHGNKYVEISFKNFVMLTGIGTWGHGNGYIKKYTIKYSYDGKIWFPYAGEHEYQGNMDTTRSRKNTFKSRLVTRYVRVYPTSSTTHACFKVELYGCEYNCGGIITRYVSLIRSPTSSKHIQELNCLWRIEPEFVTKLQIKFLYFNLRCKDGMLQLHDGNLPYSPTNDENLVEAFCGQSGKVSPEMVEGRALWVHYQSNSTSAGIAFKIQVNSYVVKTLNATSAQIRLPKTGFSNIYRYVWIIKAPRDNDTIKLTLDYFTSNNVRSLAAKCVADMIVIHHGNQEKPLVEKYCDTKHPKRFNSTNGFLKIKYKSKTNNPIWKIQFSYSILGYPTTTVYATTERDDEEILTFYKRPASGTIKTPSIKLNDSNLEATKRKARQSSSNVPIIVSCVLAVLIAVVCVVALIHYLKRRNEFLRKHPYDCSNRPMSHFGDEDATPFINTNLLMWTDSKSFEKSLPVVEVILRENEPQRLSIISPEILKSSSEFSLPGNQENVTGSLKVSDNFTEECMKLLNNNLSSAFEGNNDEYKTQATKENDEHTDENVDVLSGKFKHDERYCSLAEADRQLPEIRDSSPEAKGNPTEKDGLLLGIP